MFERQMTRTSGGKKKAWVINKCGESWDKYYNLARDELLRIEQNLEDFP